MTREEATNRLKQIRTVVQFKELAKEMRASGLDFYSKRSGAYAFDFIRSSLNSERVEYLYDRKTSTSALRGSSLIKNLHKVMKIR